MRCPSCDAETPESARFCPACGTSLRPLCPSCQSENVPGARFCAFCGETLPAGPDPAPASVDRDAAEPPERAERRRVSVLFLDLVDFTSLAESMDPEEVRSVQSRYFEVARSITATYAGTIEKFIGDAVMAVWGVPAAHEDDAERAVRAALALVYAVERIGGAAAGRDLRARAAVASGEVAVTIGAVGYGMVAGDLVNVAARLQSRAPAGGVLVDRATRDAAPNAAGFSRVGSLALKGRSQRIETFRADASDDDPARRSGVHTGRLVGRDREFRELTDLLRTVMRDRRSRLVSITGIAGMGKSRLVWELDRWIDDLPDEFAWHDGRALAYGEGVAFSALAQMVRRRTRIGEGVPPELARRQLGTVLEELIRDEAERRWLEPRLATLLASEDVAAFDRDELFAAWRRFFERIAERTPVILVFEDLQWADASLIDFIEHLATWSKSSAIFICAIARPELIDRRPGWGAGLSNFTSMTLEVLDEPAMRQLLTERVPDLPPDMVTPILEHAGGVPLYAVEIGRMLADRRSEAAPAGGRGARVAVPDSLRGLISARMDALPPGERRLLMAAAVLGHRFRPDALLSVGEGTPMQAREWLDGLVRRELLAVNEELRSPGRGELGFVQDLVREVAYHTLARGDRRRLHLAAARHLETLDDDVAEQLAGHLVEGHRLTTDPHEAKRLAHRAVSALRRAARGAVAVHAPERAFDLLEDALRLADDQQRPTLMAEAADAARAAGRLERAEGLLRDLIAVAAEAGDRPAAARARAQLASVMLSGQRNEAALAELEAAMGAMRGWRRDAAGVELAAQLARARSLLGDDRDALAWSERALAAARKLALPAVATDLLITRGTSHIALGRQEAGLEDLRAAVADAAASGLLRTELRARNNEAWALLADDPRGALETARQGVDLAAEMGMGDMVVPLADIACAAAVQTGDWDWALETVADITRRSIPPAFEVTFAATAAIIAVLRGQRRPLRALEAVLPLPADADSQVVASVQHAEAWAALVAGRLDEAHRLARQATAGFVGNDTAHERGLAIRAALWARDAAAARAELDVLEASAGWGRASAATIETLRAGLMALAGEEAAATYARARDQWRTLDLPLPLLLCLLDEASLATSRPDHDGEIEAIVERLGANGLRRLAPARPNGRARRISRPAAAGPRS